MTSCRVTASILSTAAGSMISAIRACVAVRKARTASAGTWPSSAIASAADSSISSHRRSFSSGEKIAVISGRA